MQAHRAARPCCQYSLSCRRCLSPSHRDRSAGTGDPGAAKTIIAKDLGCLECVDRATIEHSDRLTAARMTLVTFAEQGSGLAHRPFPTRQPILAPLTAARASLTCVRRFGFRAC